MRIFYLFTAIAAVCADGDVRLNVGEDYDYFYGETAFDDSYYVDGDSGAGLQRGRVEVCNATTQEWGVVCDESWSDLDASVVCQQIGFSPYGTCA